VYGECFGIDLEEMRKFPQVVKSKVHFLFSKVYHLDFFKDKVARVKTISVEDAAKFLTPVMVERVKLFEINY
jgi:hypothetical protein